MPDGRIMRQTPLPEWQAAVADWVWTPWTNPRSVLAWYPPKAPYAVLLWFDGATFTNYYVNLGGPAVVWDAGADTEDWDLDILADPDLSWRYKDEEDLLARSQWPQLYWVDDPVRVYDAAREAVALIESGAFPFDGTWRDFAAGADPTPIVDASLPPGWDQPRHR